MSEDTCPAGFIQVSEDGTHFVRNGLPFYFSGANCYYCMVIPRTACGSTSCMIRSCGTSYDWEYTVEELWHSRCIEHQLSGKVGGHCTAQHSSTSRIVGQAW